MKKYTKQFISDLFRSKSKYEDKFDISLEIFNDYLISKENAIFFKNYFQNNKIPKNNWPEFVDSIRFQNTQGVERNDKAYNIFINDFYNYLIKNNFELLEIEKLEYDSKYILFSYFFNNEILPLID